MALSQNTFRLMGLLIAILVARADQASKSAIVAAKMAGHIPMPVTSFFNLVMTFNNGISFGLFAHFSPWMPHVLLMGTSLAVVGLLIWLIRSKEGVTACALGFIAGGALGNILDRLKAGAVLDFLDFHLGTHHWPAFNLADSAIFIGVVLLVLISIVAPVKEPS